MTDHQILALLFTIGFIGLIAIMVRIKFVMLLEDLTMARHTINVLHPKAYAWDHYLASRRPGLTAKAAAAATAAAIYEADRHIEYKHLSAECDGND